MFLLSGNVTLTEVVAAQQRTVWFVLALTVAFVLFLIAAFAETNRLPFDMPEAESELVAGYHTEYSAMKFSMFFIAEYSNMLTASGLLVTLFFGGWDIPFTRWDAEPWSVPKTVLTFGAFWVKTLFFYFSYVWVRWTVPRFRFDQLMDLGWKVLLPLALVYVMIIAVAVWAAEAAGMGYGRQQAAVLTAVSLVLGGVLIFLLDRGRLIGGASTRGRPVWRTEVSHMGGD